jgi:hypothetical protein
MSVEKADALCRQYKTFYELMKDLMRCQSETEMINGIANFKFDSKWGKETRFGPVCARKLVKALMSTNHEEVLL